MARENIQRSILLTLMNFKTFHQGDVTIRFLCSQGHAGSSPVTRTKKQKSEPNSPCGRWVRISFCVWWRVMICRYLQKFQHNKTIVVSLVLVAFSLNVKYNYIYQTQRMLIYDTKKISQKITENRPKPLKKWVIFSKTIFY